MQSRHSRVEKPTATTMANGGKNSRGYEFTGVLIMAAMGMAAFIGACGSMSDDEEDLSSATWALTTSFQEGVNSYAGTTDTYIRQASPTTNYGSATRCEADGDDGSGVDKSCLIRWSVSGIPAGSIVQSATITLQALDSSANTYSLYEVKRSWNESQANWTKATSTTSWATAGASGSTDRGAAIGTVTGSGTRTITLNAAGIALVQSWVNGGTNAGIIIASASNTDGIDFASSEHATASYRPKLAVTYTTGSGAGGSGSSSSAVSSSSSSSTGSGGAGGSTDPNLLVAFIGDQGNNGNSDAVLQLIKAEGAAATVHNGDFDYASNATAWDTRIDSILGTNYPYFATVGNHDAPGWGGTNGYGSRIAARRARVPDMQCQGDLGVKSTCRFRGLYIVQSCVGTSELSGHGNCAKDSTEQVTFLKDSLAADSSIWSVCSWHKNQNDMQIGTKGDEVGWNAYKECMKAGAIVSTGHEHSYARTLTLTDVGNQAVDHGALGAFDTMQLAANKNFVFVSGLAGVGIRAYDDAGHDDDGWWASYYASNLWMKNGALQSGTATYGALFIRFNVNGDPKKATGYFKDVNGRIADTFSIQAQ